MYKMKKFLKKVCCGVLAATTLILPTQAAGLAPQNQIRVVEKDSAKGEMTVAITYPTLADEASRVLVPVWTDNNGQDDIVWYTASLGVNGWQVTVNYKNHKQETGLYHLHFYAQDGKGNLAILGGIKETLEYTPEPVQPSTPPSTPPTTEKPVIDVAVSNGKATLTLSNATHLSSDTVVYFPSWGQADGQNDIVWYVGSYVSSGKWQVTLDSAAHGEKGLYTTHVYAATSAGLTLVANTDYEIKAVSEPVTPKPPQVEEKMQILATKNAEETEFAIELKNYAPKGTLYFAVWGTVDGQNDIVWYPAQNAGKNLWSLTVKSADHKNEKGTYSVHVYDMHASAELVTHTTCELKEEEPPKQDEKTTYSSNGVKLASKDPVAGTFTVTVKNVKCNKDIKQVYIVVWSDAGGQDDIIWYEAKQNGTDWTIDVNAKADHGNHRGKYNAHAYLNTEDDELLMLGGAKPFLEWKTAKGIPGIDVSFWQGTIDWKQVKSVGVEFAMIRSSYGFDKEEAVVLSEDDAIAGHSLLETATIDEEDEEEDTRPDGQMDTKFIYNIQQAKNNGIKVGIYHYSYAETVEEVLKEAELCVAAIRSSGVSLDYPIAFDIEEASRFNAEEIENNNALIKAFCDAVEAEGYDAMVYGNPYLFSNFVDYDAINDYGIWIANWTYNDAGSYGNYSGVQLWQFSNEGSIDGIQGPVDLNVGFLN